MDTEVAPLKMARQLGDSLSETHWTRGVAAGGLLVGAILLFTGRRKSGLAVAAAGAAVALLENPEGVREFWEDQMPRLLRSSQDFLVRIEDFIEELNKQGIRLRKAVSSD